MANLRPPRVPEERRFSSQTTCALLATCDGTGFEARRDMAILRLFLDTGMRRTELANLTLADVDLKKGTRAGDGTNTAVVMGKGQRPRACPFGRKTAQAIDRYIRARARHLLAGEPWLWQQAGAARRYQVAPRWSSGEASRPAYNCTLIYSGTPSPTPCSPVACRRAT